MSRPICIGCGGGGDITDAELIWCPECCGFFCDTCFDVLLGDGCVCHVDVPEAREAPDGSLVILERGVPAIEAN